MKLFFFFFLLATSFSFLPTSHLHELHSAFISFLTAYHKHYESTEELTTRFNTFKKNYDFIKKFQEESRSTGRDLELAVNQFADLTDEEFRDLYAKYKTAPSRFPCKAKHQKITANETINWVLQKKVTRVKDQGNCGSCWAFSAIGAVESLYAIEKSSLVEFSEQELVDCAGKYGDNEGCDGGDMCQAFDYVKDNGISLAKEYKYEAKNGRCRKASKAFVIAECVNVTKYDNAELLEALTRNPVSVAIASQNKAFKFYKKGILTESECTGEVDHGVLLVGAGEENGRKYWLVKNSWGTSWGMAGFVKIQRDSGKGRGACGIATDASYPVAN